MIIKSIKKKIRRAKTVSFDIYDTLIRRDTSIPEEIFIRAGSNVLSAKDGIAFARSRILAEKNARIHSTRNGEVSLDEIYQHLEYRDDIKILLKHQECQEEIKSVRRRTEIYNLYNECIRSGKEVYLISDMYLPRVVIEECLEKCGICYYKALLISNECNSSKRNGTLFKTYLHEYGIDPATALHIGDSYYADFKSPRENGMDSVWLVSIDFLERKVKRYIYFMQRKK